MGGLRKSKADGRFAAYPRCDVHARLLEAARSFLRHAGTGTHPVRLGMKRHGIPVSSTFSEEKEEEEEEQGTKKQHVSKADRQSQVPTSSANLGPHPDGSICNVPPTRLVPSSGCFAVLRRPSGAPWTQPSPFSRCHFWIILGRVRLGSITLAKEETFGKDQDQGGPTPSWEPISAAADHGPEMEPSER
jgi:hypothetical protein